MERIALLNFKIKECHAGFPVKSVGRRLLMFPQLGNTKNDPAVNLAHCQEEKMNPKYFNNYLQRNLSPLCVLQTSTGKLHSQHGRLSLCNGFMEVFNNPVIL